ncbi:SGNH/GDSL hydrolase family protein [Clostridium ganghwense]|uniref:GDSL-type esterase/lipase family protein n=1 Tax=Clostridium ganghwense TaxID=312089 RepID=A0ABT4CP88_9CLOT|nr:GDSL-type esterase/lipase family protein [Clostridium ganghwense]MCY6370046.1 GDSL-type esterase/lipase family protein [Clostridium ganghwense]
MNKRKFISCMLIFLLFFLPVQSQAATNKAETNITTINNEDNKLLLPIVKYVSSMCRLNPQNTDYTEKLIYAIITIRYLEEQNSIKSEGTTKYIALGDSIAFGLSADLNKGYVDLFKNYLKTTEKYDELVLNNLAMTGDKSSDLLDKVKNDVKTRDAIRQANIITISIGGNNLLSPVIKAIASKYKLDSEEANFVIKLTNAIEEDPNWEEKLEILKNDSCLMKELDEGINNFKEDWPKIIKEINSLAPNAKIYVMTIYNPLKADTPVLYNTFEKLIQPINEEIKNSIYDYKVAEVYTKFHEYDGEIPLTNFDLINRSIDPHPTNYGHQIIFKAHCKSLK